MVQGTTTWANVIGLTRNSRLVERIGWELANAQAEAERKDRPSRRLTQFPDGTLTIWFRRRRVVARGRAPAGQRPSRAS